MPGIPPWDQIVRNPLLWHFDFGGPDMERLVAGRERIYLDRFWNDFAGDRSKIDEATRKHYADLPAGRHALSVRAVSFDPAGRRRQCGIHGNKVTMPVLAVGGEKSFGANEAVVTALRNAAVEVTELVIPNSGHWLMEEQPATTISAVRKFLSANRRAPSSNS